jgi:hypothetical protein
LNELQKVLGVEDRPTRGDHDEGIRRNNVRPVIWNPEFAPLLILREHPPLTGKTVVEEQSELLPKPWVKGMGYPENLTITVTIVCILACGVPRAPRSP